jgi:hypothetical protein
MTMLGIHPDAITHHADHVEDSDLHAVGGALTNLSALHRAGALTHYHVMAVKDWTTTHYRDVNDHLRNGTPAGAWVRGTIKHLDHMIASNPIPHGVHVYRGVHGPLAEPLKSVKAGDVLSNRGFTSTSLSPHRVTHFAKGEHMMHIELPQGSHAMYVSHPDINTNHTMERELVLPRSAKLRYLGNRQVTIPEHHYDGTPTGAVRRLTMHHMRYEE